MALPMYMFRHNFIPLALCFAFVLIVRSSDEIKERERNLDQDKLDRILTTIETVLVNQDELRQLIHAQSAILQGTKSSLVGGGQSASQDARVLDTTRFSNNEANLHIKNEKPDSFRFNKLAGNLIPSSSTWPAEDEADSSDWSRGLRGDQKQLALAIGQHYEGMFSDSLEKLSTMIREQTVGFRQSLLKLMNRVVDHTYQYNSILNQLSLIRDECSVMATPCQVVQATNNQQQHEEPKPEERGPTYRATTSPMGTLHSSDVATIVRLLALELQQLVSKGREESEEEEQRGCKSAELMGEIVSNKTGNLSRRLDVIDSVVRQSAVLLTKLSSICPSPNSPGGDKLAQEQVVLIYNNKQNESNSEMRTNGTQGSRWYPGSKIPGKGREPERAQPLASGQTRPIRPRQRCQSKTNLIRPSSCQQLRLAGANCTGQYYVFVRGSIQHVYCDMNMDSDDDGGGWTVIFRRIDKSLISQETSQPLTNNTRSSNRFLDEFRASQENFNLDWANYKRGFGYLDEWAEFFLGLDLLAQLTADSRGSTNITELQVDLETRDSNELHLRFDRFKVESEESQFRLLVGGCNASQLCEPILQLNGSKFYTHDRIGNNASHCKQPELPFGWWIPEQVLPVAGCGLRDSFAPLTAPIGRLLQPNNGNSQGHLQWPASNWAHWREPLRKLVMKIRTKQAAQTVLDDKLRGSVAGGKVAD